MAVFRVVLDACVLYPIGLTDLLVTASRRGLYQAYWSPEILQEVRRNVLADRPDVRADALDRRLQLMDTALDSANIVPPVPPVSLVDAMTNDPKDRHVLALAVHVGAEVIVTNNLKDFPAEACDPHGIEAQSADVFAAHLVSLSPVAMWDTICEMAERRRRPPETPEDVLDHLERVHLPSAMAALRAQHRGHSL